EYVMVFRNQGQPVGPWLEHALSQLIATPIVPMMVAEELAGGLQHFRIKHRCIWCDIVRQECRGGERLVLERGGFVARAPFASRSAWEGWPPPTEPRPAYEEPPADEFPALARVLAEALKRMSRTLGDCPYNLMLHNGPLRAGRLDHFHWHVEIIPMLTR